MQKLSTSALAVTLLLILSKLLGFIRELTLAYQFGTSYIVDVYTACITLPSVLFAMYAYGISDAYIPVYMRIKEEPDRDAFFSNVLSVFSVISVFVSLLCFVGAKRISTLLAPGFDAQAQALLIHFIRLISPVFPVLMGQSLFSAQLQAKERFVFTNFCAFIVVNIVEIAGILLASKAAPDIMIYGYLLSGLTAVILLSGYAIRKTGLHYTPCLQLQNPRFFLLCRMAIPLGISRLVNQLNGVVDRVFASTLGEGVISALSYADKIQLIFYSLTTSVFLSVCYPQINSYFAKGNIEGGLYFIRKAFMLAVYLSLPVMGGLFLFSKPLVAFLLERGNFSADSTAMTADCLAFYALGVPFYALRQIGTQALSAHMEQRKILKNTVISVSCNILLDFLLAYSLGYIGLAAATSLAGLIASILVLFDLRKLEMRVLDRTQMPQFLKILTASLISLLLCWCCYHILLNILGNSLSLMIAGCTAIVSYICLSVMLRIEIFIWLYVRLPARFQIFSMLNQ